MKVTLREQTKLDLSAINFINGMVAKNAMQVSDDSGITKALKYEDSQDFEKTILLSDVKTVQIGFLTCNVRVGFYNSLVIESIEGSVNNCLRFMGDWKTNFKALEGEHWEITGYCADIE